MLCSGQNIDKLASLELIECRGTARSGRPSSGTQAGPPKAPMMSSSVELRADEALVPSDASAAATLRSSASLGSSSLGSAHDHDILTTAEGSARLGIFVDFIRAADLSAVLEGKGPFTVFAPTDRAFSKIPVSDRVALLADRNRLRQVMRGHIVVGSMAATSETAPSSVTTLEKTTLVLTSVEGALHVGNARLVQTNIPASNGTIHAIDSVLLPT